MAKCKAIMGSAVKGLNRGALYRTGDANVSEQLNTNNYSFM